MFRRRLAEEPYSSSDLPLCGIPASPVPAGARAGFLTTGDGVRIRYAHFPADRGVRARGTLTILSGRTEFIEKYYEVVREAAARGFACALLDWRGQGGSQRLLRNAMKGHIPHFQDYQEDLEAFVREIVLPDCPAPHYLIGHSMGAAIALESVVEGHRWFERMVLLSPMLSIKLGPATGVARVLARALRGPLGTAFIPGGTSRPITERPFPGNPVTSDLGRYALATEMVRAHPHLGLGSPTIGWLAEAFDVIDRLARPEVIREIRQPLLLVGAGADPIVDLRSIEHLSQRLIAGGHVVVPGARHELLMEADRLRAQAWAAIDAFLPQP